MRAGWVFVLLSMIACAPAIPHLPSQGGPAWFEIKSEHFRLWTDDSIERGRQVGLHDYVAKFDRQGLIASLKEQTANLDRAA